MDLALDFCAGRQNITQHSRSSRQYDKGIGVKAGGGCARNDCRCARAGEPIESIQSMPNGNTVSQRVWGGGGGGGGGGGET